MGTWKNSLGVYADRSVISIALLGFASGLPFFLTGSTLVLWLKSVGITNASIGVFSLCSLPYAFKFLWSPFVDRLNIPFLNLALGRRRSWLLFSQLVLILAIFGLSFTDPATSLTLTAFFAFAIAFFSATQDTVMLAYQVERLQSTQYGPGEAMGVFGYRMGMLVSGAGALYLTEYLAWNQVYQVMALILGVGVLTTLSIKEPAVRKDRESEIKEEKVREYLSNHPKITGLQARILSWCYGAIVCPFIEFISRPTWLIALGIMFFYKLANNLMGNMINLFFADMGYSMSEIASASKVFGMVNSILGGFIGGICVVRLGNARSLFSCAILHGISILFYCWMSVMGHNMSALYVTTAIGYITNGMCITALFAYQMTLVNPTYAATQLALLTSVVHLGRSLIASASGLLVDSLGWNTFFILCAGSTIVPLIFITLLARVPIPAPQTTAN
jgi:PAT family beta-lactamase induction signal transducer AmpG